MTAGAASAYTIQPNCIAVSNFHFLKAKKTNNTICIKKEVNINSLS
jgi:hypothetical protein